ncbi:pantoate--beta-alanine ligase [Stenotrophomonas sp. SY1]|jgi:pantoate--beta-alanine ligase|uniref:pantoate--beta-alanine ligase n=1 Tax=Stenotrophomonas sp. SY1 TaxID=477235 RepID=UPI001E463E3D|nr:pantoate--beta-alanine ligase [Stenotrophomonas sp. SY1]MCD9088801.1 pantoate--beta-alanine ligase [Stenotrophomonas sp. SY1]
MIETVTELARLRAVVAGWKREGLRVALVPTMGNLHAGHYSLVKLARQHADRVVSSVFVNPTQFGPNEDFTRYPRTPEADTTGLQNAGCDVLWLPTVESMYPFGVELAANVHVPGVSALLEGAHRPGHFDGVCTVVSRLFNQVQPDVAAFGRKDYQQLAVIRQMVADLAFPIEIIGGEIVREEDGLAMSSRNQYLTADVRPQATVIRKVLLAMRDAYLSGTAQATVEAEGVAQLQAAGFLVDYAVVRLPDLASPGTDQNGPRVALVAAKLGNTRLIDNIEF